MTNKERFIAAVNRFIEYREKKEKKSSLLEEAFGSDTVIFDFDGIEELISTITDVVAVMLPNLADEVIKDNIEWYIYEATGMDKPSVEGDGKEWIVDTPSTLYDMLEHFNNAEAKEEATTMDTFFDTMEKNLKS